MFPLGGMRKTEVRALAEECGFVNAAKPDSQDICFVGIILAWAYSPVKPYRKKFPPP